jgi:hypothetical protein
MASWAPPLPSQHGVEHSVRMQASPKPRIVRVGHHLVAERDLGRLADRLSELEHELSEGPSKESPGRRLAHDCVTRDLDVLSTALARARRRAN